MTTEQWPEMPGKLYRDGADLVDGKPLEIPAGYLSGILPMIKETGGRVPFSRPAEPDDEDHPEDCGCPDYRDDADRDTADEHEYDYEIWADADASREDEGL